MTAKELHVLTMKIQNAIYAKHHIFLTVGVYAVDTTESASNKQAHLKEDMMKHDGVKGCHGIFINEEDQYISFDILLDFKIQDKEAFKEALTKDVMEDFPGYTININFDVDYTD